MKKAMSFILVLAMCLSLCACGKSEAVKNTETLIASIGDVSLESKDAIISARNAYDSLKEEEKEAVEGYDLLISAEEKLIKLEEHEAVCEWLVGEWVCLNNYLGSLEGDLMTYLLTGTMPSEVENITPMSFGVDYAVVEGEETTWEVVENTLCVGELDFSIFEDNGVVFLQDDSNVFFIRQDNLNKVITTVELTAENVNDYIELRYYEIEYVDAFGNGTGQYDCGVATSNKVFDDGLIYLSSSDIAIEVLIPHDYITTLGDTQYWSIYSSGSDAWGWENGQTVVDTVFGAVIYGFSNGAEPELNFHPESLTLGNAKGTITFVNAEYVKNISNEGGHKITLTNGLSSITGYWCNGVDWPENILA